MKFISILLGSALALYGCSFHNKQNDLADNQFYEKEIYADSSAPYVGDWAIDSYKWRKTLIINSNGKVKIVLSPGYGAIDGKIYLEDGNPYFILRDGTKTEIIKNEEDSLYLENYGEQETLAALFPQKKGND